MDIDLLSKMIRELILDKDSVCLPGLGSFVAEIVPSSFSDRGYTINPPYRRLYFRQQQGDDDSLAALYAQSNGVDRELALKILTDYLVELKGVLQQKKTIVFPGLGRLRATKENNFFFVPDEDLDIYPDGFGLEPVSLKTHQETPQEVSAAVSSLEEILHGDSTAVADNVPEAVQDVPETVQEVHEVLRAVPEAVQEEQPSVPQEHAPEPMQPQGSVEEPAPEPMQPQGSVEEPAPESVEAPVEEIVTAPAEKAVAKPAEPAEPSVVPETRAGMPSWLKVTLISLMSVIGLLLLALLVFLLLAQIAPDFIDSLLYTPEELRIINY